MKTRNNLVKVHGLLMDNDDRVVLEGIYSSEYAGIFSGPNMCPPEPAEFSIEKIIREDGQEIGLEGVNDDEIERLIEDALIAIESNGISGGWVEGLDEPY